MIQYGFTVEYAYDPIIKGINDPDPYCTRFVSCHDCQSARHENARGLPTTRSEAAQKATCLDALLIAPAQLTRLPYKDRAIQ